MSLPWAVECLSCGSSALFRVGRCDGCYRFWRVHGRDRTFDELLPILKRRLEREQARDLIRSVLGRA